MATSYHQGEELGAWHVHCDVCGEEINIDTDDMTREELVMIVEPWGWTITDDTTTCRGCLN